MEVKKVIKMKDTDMLGILMIAEKYCWPGIYSLNNILLEDGKIVAVEDTKFEEIGEIELDD